MKNRLKHNNKLIKNNKLQHLKDGKNFNLFKNKIEIQEMEIMRLNEHISE